LLIFSRISSSSEQVKAARGVTSVDQRISVVIEALQAHQSQNGFLAQQIKQISTEKKDILFASNQLLATLNEEVKETRAKYIELRRFMLKEGGLTDQFLFEVEELKGELFRVLATSIKANFAQQGKNINVSVEKLYEEKGKNVSFKNWAQLISSELEKILENESNLSKVQNQRRATIM